ncbi:MULTISPECIES: restriction endonuclease subunit S [Pseudomonas]|uniref:restriction endonuclease subunit S n=1 Tax=Pseudomonas TaxID=286 RepID=UPI001BCEC73B|nr:MULTISPECIES: restriction endonuclease subunit S [Pseudomonas]MBS7560408.1 restriction endonuclease subunit S [Pseudomonas sp. RC4D1]MDP9525793.1 restriction endonuclease subunit S [Pseudomonas protegens]
MSSELRKRWVQAGVDFPESWKFVSFEELLRDSKSIAVGVMYPGPNTVGGVPLIKVGDVSGGFFSSVPKYCISPDVNEEYKRTQLVGDELLITLVGNPGECVVVQQHMSGWNAARAIAVVRLADSSLRIYLKAVLESRACRHLIDAVLNTTVQKTLNLKDIRLLPIPMPPKQVIEAVSSFSDVVSDRVTLLRETNATLETIAQALFKSWFVDFDPVRAKAQGLEPEGMDTSTAELFPNSFEEFEQGAVPVGWKLQKVEDLIELSYGKALKATDRVDGPVPVYGSGGITGSHNESLVNGPSVIVGRKGTVGSLFWEDRPFFPIDTVFYVRTDKPLTYCYYLLKTLGLEGMNTDGAVPGLNRNNVYRLPVVVAPKSVLESFDEIVFSLREKIFSNNQLAQTLTQLRDTLLPRLISGQLRLPEAAAATEKILSEAI